MEEEIYRQSKFRERRGLADEILRFSLCFALSEHARAFEIKGRHRAVSGMDVAGIKAGILGESVRAGDEVEGEALACGCAAVYQPRAYYPPYFLGEMRAALRRGENPPSASPHYLPVSAVPPLPDGWRITFLLPGDKEAFDRPDFPAHVRDVLTRDYLRMPLLIPPGEDPGWGRIRFRARVLQLRRDTMDRLAGLGERSYDAYAARGLTHFLQPLEMELEPGKEHPTLRGSLFAEVSFLEEPGWERVMGVLEGAVRGTVEEVFPECPRGEKQEMGCYLPHTGFHVVQFRRKLFALVFDPVITVFRSPDLVGLYLPCDLMRDLEKSASLFEGFVSRFAAVMEESLGLSTSPRVEAAYDNRLPWARDGGALRGASFLKVEEEHPFLKPTLDWLRGDRSAAT